MFKRICQQEVIPTDPLDRNKTDLTHRLTALTCAYFAGMGCKPVETEVIVSAGWIADVGTFIYPTATELKQAKILKRFFPDDVGKSWKQANKFLSWYGTPLTVMAEVKISKEDFKRDIDKKFKGGAAHLCYLTIPLSLEAEIINVIPKYWGIILCSNDGERIIKVTAPSTVFAQHAGEVIDFIANVAIRREHRTAYVGLRSFLKAYRAGK